MYVNYYRVQTLEVGIYKYDVSFSMWHATMTAWQQLQDTGRRHLVWMSARRLRSYYPAAANSPL